MSEQWELADGERYAFRQYVYRPGLGNLVVLNSEFEVDRVIARDMPEGLYKKLFEPTPDARKER